MDIKPLSLFIWGIAVRNMDLIERIIGVVHLLVN
jgi:hypothetical protein